MKRKNKKVYSVLYKDDEIGFVEKTGDGTFVAVLIEPSLKYEYGLGSKKKAISAVKEAYKYEIRGN